MTTTTFPNADSLKLVSGYEKISYLEHLFILPHKRVLSSAVIVGSEPIVVSVDFIFGNSKIMPERWRKKNFDSFQLSFVLINLSEVCVEEVSTKNEPRIYKNSISFCSIAAGESKFIEFTLEGDIFINGGAQGFIDKSDVL